MTQLQLAWRPFAFNLPQPLQTARGRIGRKRGWLLRLQAADGGIGWGEAAPLELDGLPDWRACARALALLPVSLDRRQLEAGLADGTWPAPLAFALGAALAELDGLVPAAGWRPAPVSAELLPAGEALLPALERLLARGKGSLTLKWKVAAYPDALERQLLERLLERLPASARLRLDANGGWDRPTAEAWGERLQADPRLQWLEQPLAPHDLQGLEQLARRLPVALDESLQQRPALREAWPGWQVRRPSQEGDPRPFFLQLQAGRPHLMLSTAFETGIGQRWLGHLAALQQEGPTPVAPGLAPGWRPDHALFASDPRQVWAAARESLTDPIGDVA